MIKYNLRTGDLIVVQDKVALITKQTKNYCYYFYMGKPCRIRKDKLWSRIDRGKNIKVEFQKDVKRKKQRKMRTLDLHGFKYEKVDDRVRQFLNFIELPCKIITGNSQSMKKIVKTVVTEYGWATRELDSYNTGTLLIFE